MIYAEDSLFTLTPPARLGLLFLTLVLSVGLLALAAWAMRGRGLAVRLVLAVGLFALFA